MSFPKFVKLVEVGPRDGLQNEKKIIPTDIKIELINRLSRTGLSVIEATSFVSPKWIPQFKDSENVFRDLEKNNDIKYLVLIPNLKGLESAINLNVEAIAVFTTPSETFSQKNTNRSVAQSMIDIKKVIDHAKEKRMWVRGYISCVFVCPYEGNISPHKVLAQALALKNMGCDEISLGDTTGKGSPISTEQLLSLLLTEIPVHEIAVHFHDTYHLGLVNIFTALKMGIHIVDSSIAGLGGCPYAKGATGNVATEKVLYLLNSLNIKTNVDFEKVQTIAHWIKKYLKY